MKAISASTSVDGIEIQNIGDPQICDPLDKKINGYRVAARWVSGKLIHSGAFCLYKKSGNWTAFPIG
jgi:hypothetical protein